MATASVAARRTTPPLGYWIFAMVLEVFAIPTVFSIGFPLMVLGGVLVLVGLVYRWTALFWTLVVVAVGGASLWIYDWVTGF